MRERRNSNSTSICLNISAPRVRKIDRLLILINSSSTSSSAGGADVNQSATGSNGIR